MKSVPRVHGLARISPHAPCRGFSFPVAGASVQRCLLHPAQLTSARKRVPSKEKDPLPQHHGNDQYWPQHKLYPSSSHGVGRVKRTYRQYAICAPFPFTVGSSPEQHPFFWHPLGSACVGCPLGSRIPIPGAGHCDPYVPCSIPFVCLRRGFLTRADPYAPETDYTGQCPIYGKFCRIGGREFITGNIKHKAGRKCAMAILFLLHSIILFDWPCHSKPTPGLRDTPFS